MPCDTIKFKVFQDPLTKNAILEVYRPYGDKNELMRVDYFNEMTVNELKCLTEYLIYIFNKAKKQ